MSQIYDLVPPPGHVAGDLEGFRLRAPKFIRKAARGVARGVKKAGRGVVKVTKFSLKYNPVTLTAKYGLKGLKAMGKFAAKPIRNMFRKLAMRRAKYLSWQNRKSLAPNVAEKAKGGQYAIGKMKRNPLTRVGLLILKHTWGTSVAGDANIDAAALGMTGAEIAAAAASVVAAITGLMKSLNKNGEAPADPTTEPSASDNAPAADPAEAPAEPPTDEPTEDASGADPAKANPVKVTPSAVLEKTIVKHMMSKPVNKGVTVASPNKLATALAKHGMTPAGVVVKPWKPTRFVTLAEVDDAIHRLKIQKGATRRLLEDALVKTLYARGIGIVPDVNALPPSELAARKAGGLANLAGALKGKKAYRGRVKKDDPACHVANPWERYPGETEDEYESRIARKQAGRKGLRMSSDGWPWSRKRRVVRRVAARPSLAPPPPPPPPRRHSAAWVAQHFGTNTAAPPPPPPPPTAAQRRHAAALFGFPMSDHCAAGACANEACPCHGHVH